MDVDEPASRSELHDLALRAADDDRDALDALLTSLYDGGPARRAVASVLIASDDIEEAAQDTVIAVARSIGSFRGDAAFETWLWTIGKRCAADLLGRKRRTTPLGDDDELVGEIQRISSMIATRRTLEDVIAILPERYAAAVYLRDVEGQSYEQIAERLDLKLNTVRTRIARGRAMAAAALEHPP